MPTAKELRCIPWPQRLREAQEYIETYIAEDESDLYGLGYAMDLINSVIKEEEYADK